jgi:hypothetical protein
MIRRWIGKVIWLVLRAAGKCLAVFLLDKMIKEKCKMLTVDNGNGKKVSLWGALGQIALAGIASYGMTKINNPDNTPWAPYRDQMVGGMASTAMSFMAQQMAAAQQPQAGTDETTTAQ